MEKKLLSLMLLAVFSLIATAAPREETIISPNGNIRIEVTIGDQLQYSVYHGNEQVLTATDYLAVIIQHETDHLDGILYIDHLSRLKRNMIIKKLQKQS